MSDRLLYLFWDFPKLSETFIAAEIGWLSRRGFTIDILARRIEPGLLGLFPGLSLEMIMPYQGIRLGRGLIRRAVPTRVTAAVMNQFSYARKFRLSRVSPRAYRGIIAHFGPIALTACALRRQLGLQAPVIGVFHGYDMSRYVARKGPDVYRDSEIDAFMAISKHWAKSLRKMGIASERIATNQLGVDLSFLNKFAAESKRDEIKHTYRLVSAGRLVEKKGFEILLRAIAQLDGDVRNQIRLDIIGEGVEGPTLSDLALQLGLDTVVSFWGPMSHPELLARVASADLFVLASRTASDGDMEGIPVVLMEAMGLRVPVISTRHSGIAELVQDRVTGFLVTEGDVRALAGAIDTFVRNPASSWRLCDAAYDRIAGHFTFDRYGERLTRLIDKTHADYLGGGH